MRILPVIDLKDGLVVRGIAGRREEYRPIVSQLAQGARPCDIAAGLRQLTGMSPVYVADLDALAGAEPDWVAYTAILSAGLTPWIDAGVADEGRGLRLLTWCAAQRPAGEGRYRPRAIICLEALRDWQLLAVLSKRGAAAEPSEIIFSLDLRGGRPWTAQPQWSERAPRELAAEALAHGVQGMLVLDVADVGVGRGVSTLPLCATLRREFPAVELLAGGGVRNVADLTALEEAGCDWALVASALHDGRLSRDDLRPWLDPSP